MTHQRQRLGESGEDLAVRELTARGYAILDRRYRTKHGEIDIVAEHGAAIVFVEVRARATGEFGRAAESNRKQIRRWVRYFVARGRIDMKRSLVQPFS